MAIQNYNESEIEQKFLALPENEFSKEILVPLFQSIYKDNSKVQFIGGQNEKGKDILIERTDEFLNKSLTVVQTKKTKWSSNAATNSFQNLITQLNQALSEPITEQDTGREIHASSFIAATPYFIDQTVIDHHSHSYKFAIHGKNIQFFDGRKILDLIKHHNPNLLDKLFGASEILKSTIYGKINLNDIKKALGLDRIKSLEEIYCTSEILIGGNHYIELFNSKITCNSKIPITIKDSFINDILDLRKTINEKFDLEILDIDSIEALKIHKEQTSLFIANSRKLQNQINVFKEDSYKNKYHKSISDDLEESESSNDFHKILFLTTKDRNESDLNTVQLEQLKNINSTAANLKEIQERIENNEVTITIESKKIVNEIENLKSSLKNSNVDDSYSLKNYLIKLEKISILLKPIKLIEKELTLEKNKIKLPQKSLDITRVFETKINIAVLGEAGSGKTTNLKSFIKKLIDSSSGRFVYFSTLSKLGRICEEIGSRSIQNSIIKDIQSISDHINRDEVIDEFRKGNATIALDSIDEAISEYPWIIDSIIDFSNLFQKLQLITSSRYSIKDIDKIPFAHVSLLPFNEKQKSEFFNKWFSEHPQKAKEIIEHIRCNQTLSKIVVNPLSATILCTLKENGINLPNSEIQLYTERFNLLAGKFDLVKEVNRLKNSPDKIISAAQYCALSMHKLGVRELQEKDFINSLNESNIATSEIQEIEIYNDLLTSEIIQKTTGQISFGHLKFQEFLASREILTNKSFSNKTLFESSWWFEVMKLCAKGSRDVDWLLNYALSNDLAFEHRALLFEIIDESNIKNKESWKSRIKRSGFIDSEADDDAFLHTDDFEDSFENPFCE